MATPRASTEVDAANLALSFLREQGVASLSDGSTAAIECLKWFGNVREEVLREHEWNCAEGWVTPAVDLTANPGPLTKRYPLPTDSLRVRQVWSGNFQLGADDWRVITMAAAGGGVDVESRILICNIDTPNVCYTRNITDVRLWDPDFLIAFAIRLASYMAPAFGKSFDETEKMSGFSDDRIDGAAQRDAREQAPTSISRDTSWVTSRFAWRGRR